MPSFRLAAACLLGEIYRGQADFSRAQQFYQLSIDEAEAIPGPERPGNDWYAHYGPRAVLGLALVLRRTLGDPQMIRALLQRARDNFAGLPGADLPAQLGLMEGLLHRQLGDVEGAAGRLREAVDALAPLEPPFLLLWPDHGEAFIAQTCLLSYESRALVPRQASALLRSSDSGQWTIAVSASVLLHLRLDMLLDAGADADRVRDDVRSALAASGPDSPSSLLRRLRDAAEKEGDPVLLTESDSLHAAWHGGAGDLDAVTAHLARLDEHSHGAVAPMVLLRAIEGAALWRASFGDAAAPPALHALLHRGRMAFTQLEAILPAYRCQAIIIDRWRRCLEGGAMPSPEDGSYWLSDELIELRLRMWP